MSSIPNRSPRPSEDAFSPQTPSSQSSLSRGLISGGGGSGSGSGNGSGNGYAHGHGHGHGHASELASTSPQTSISYSHHSAGSSSRFSTPQRQQPQQQSLQQQQEYEHPEAVEQVAASFADINLDPDLNGPGVRVRDGGGNGLLDERRSILDEDVLGNDRNTVIGTKATMENYGASRAVNAEEKVRMNQEAEAEEEEEEMKEVVHFVLLAEFDIDQGSTLAYQYPYPTGTDEHRLAELMLPDGAHLRSEDWTIFYLGQDHQLAIDPMLAHETTILGGDENDDHDDVNGEGGDGDGDRGRAKMDKRASMFLPSERPKRGAVGGGLLHVLSCVRCKEDKTVKRGAMVKSLAICTPVPWIEVFKPILLLALEEYFSNPSPEVLEHLYDKCNSASLLGIPRFTRAEKLLMRLSDRKDLFQEKYEAAAAKVSASMREAEMLAVDVLGDASGGNGSKTRESLGMIRKDSASSSSSALALPTVGNGMNGRYTPERKGMRDTHYFDAEVKFRKVNVPMKIPLATFDEEIGDYSLVELITTLSNSHSPFPAPFHPYLHTNGASTHPVILLINALLSHKRVLVLGTQFPAHSVARAVLAVCALGTGCGQVLRGISETALPYCNLSCYEMLEGMSGFVAGVTNPRFVDLPCWDVLCDIETGRVSVSKNLRDSGESWTGTGVGMGAGAGAGAGAGPGGAGLSEISLGSTIRGDESGLGGGNASAGGSGPGSQGKNQGGQKSDCVDNQFMEEIMSAINSHYGEMYIRRRMTDYIARFTRLAAYQEYQNKGATRVGYPITAFRVDSLGTGTTFADDQKKQREMWANGARIEAWRRTKGYRLYAKDWAKEASRRKLPFDVQHQMARLRTGQNVSDLEAEGIFSTLAAALETPEQILELLIQCPPHFGGLTPIANGLFHRWSVVRAGALETLMQIQTHPIGRHAIASLNYFQRKAFLQLIEQHQAAAAASHAAALDEERFPSQSQTTPTALPVGSKVDTGSPDTANLSAYGREGLAV